MLELQMVSLVIVLPIIGAFFVLVTNNDKQANFVALWSSFFVFSCFLFTFLHFDFSYHGLSYVHELLVNHVYEIKYRVGLDKISIFFVALTTLLTFLCVLWLGKTEKSKKTLALTLAFESFAIGTFCADNIFLLFIFIEASIIAIILLFGWNKSAKILTQFVLYMSLSSIFFLIAIIMIYIDTKTSTLSQIHCIENKSIFWLLLVSLGIKLPVWPCINWLPKMQSSSRTVCMVLLSSVVLSYNTLIVVRFLSPFFLFEVTKNQNSIIIACLISMFFAIANLAQQKDIKKIIAYFAVLHSEMYFILFACNLDTKYFVFSMLQNSIIIAILFFITSIIKSIFKTTMIDEIQAMSNNIINTNIKNIVLPATLALIGVPFSCGFVA